MKIIEKIEKILLWIGMATMFSIMIIIAVDALGRSFFGHSIPGVYTIIEQYLMVCSIFVVMGYTWGKKGHIAVTIVTAKLPVFLRNALHIMSLLLGICFCLIITKSGYDLTVDAIARHTTTQGLITWPIWLSKVWMLVGGFAFLIRLVLELIYAVIRSVKEGFGKVELSKPSEKHDLGVE